MSALTSGLDKKFLSRIIFNSVLVSVVLGGIFIAAGPHLPPRFGWSFLFGALCGVTNLYLLKRIVESMAREKGKSLPDGLLSLAALQVLVVGFLYTIYRHYFHVVGQVTGFSVVLAVIVIKAAGGAFNRKGE